MITEQEPGLDALLEHLARYRGIDFSGYKQPSLIRRVASRMRAAGAVIVCTEMVLFELLEQAGTAEFKQILALVK